MNNADLQSSKSSEELLSSDPGVETKDISPRDLLRFAKIILFSIALLFVLASITEVMWPKNAVFETCKTILPSIATLVIGYYFGSSANNN